MGELLTLAAEAAGGQHHHLVGVQLPVNLETMTLITQALRGVGLLPAVARRRAPQHGRPRARPLIRPGITPRTSCILTVASCRPQPPHWNEAADVVAQPVLSAAQLREIRRCRRPAPTASPYDSSTWTGRSPIRRHPGSGRALLDHRSRRTCTGRTSPPARPSPCGSWTGRAGAAPRGVRRLHALRLHSAPAERRRPRPARFLCPGQPGRPRRRSHRARPAAPDCGPGRQPRPRSPAPRLG